MMTHDTHAGRVLSAKNKALVKDSVAALSKTLSQLQALLDQAKDEADEAEGRTAHNADRERHHMTSRIERLSLADDSRTFTGYASVFDTPIDAYMPTVIRPGAFTATLADPDQRRRMRLLYGHEVNEVIGKIEALREDGRGLYIQARLSDTPRGNEVYTLLKDGALDEMSIGFNPVDYTIAPDGPNGSDVRYLTAVQLFEVSVVSFAANAAARVQTVHQRVNVDVVGRVGAALRELELDAIAAGIVL